MGNKKQAVDTKKRKKKGRPSLLELQKRSLRLEKSQNPNPNPNPYVKFPARRSTRRNPDPNLNEKDEEEEEEEEDSNAKRKEKKLNLMLRISKGSDLAEGGPDSDGNGSGSRKKRKIDNVERTARQNSSSKVTGEGDPVPSGPTTPLPDKKLLVFILDRLQKKDTYGVFSEPVDPEELPDYHDIIKHPMDFGTVRRKLEKGAYENLEQFESDVFLISSNAMLYNATETIYFRQARSIQELAKKDFENLRQESDDNGTQPKTVRRGRPPIKNIMKRIGRPPTDRTGSEFSSDATLANARDGTHNSNPIRDVLRKGSSFDKPITMDESRVNVQHRSERNEEYSGSLLKGIPMKNWKKFSEIDENRRNTSNQPLQSTHPGSSILTSFDGEKKLLMPVGLYLEHAYARSLARFAAKLGPIGWEIAAKRIESLLPPGTKFGPGWVGDSEAQHLFKSKAKLDELSEDTALKNSPIPPSISASTATTTSCGKPVDSGAKSVRLVEHEGEYGKLQFCENSSMQPLKNGFKPGYGLNLTRLPEIAMAHGHVLNMVSRSGNNNDNTLIDVEGNAMAVAGNSNANTNFDGKLRGQLVNSKPSSGPPDLNVDFQSTGSPVSGVSGDSKQQQQPELALQL